MASSQHRVPPPPCPVCQQTDQVMRLPVAYEAGLTRFGPPAMPVARVPMIKYIIVGFALVTVGVFFILIWSGVGGYGGWPIAVQIIQVVLTLAAIVVALVLSFIAFQRVVRGDLQSQKYLPAWDQAMENWRRLYYCKRDNVVFDPQTNKVLSDTAVRSLLSVDTALDVATSPQQAEQAQTQSAQPSHQ